MQGKVTGYILLAIGILVIAIAGFSVYQVVTKQAQPIQVFNFPGVSLDASSMLPSDSGELSLPAGALPKMEILTPEMINLTSNLFLHIFVMGFMVNIGYKISSLGVMLIRPIEVKLKENVIK